MGNKLDFLYNITLLAILPVIMFGVIHEQRHKTIAESFGCEAEINYLPNLEKNAFMYTEVGTNCLKELSKKEIVAMRTMQSNVETTGYQLIPVLMLAIIAAVVTKSNFEHSQDTVKVEREKLEQVIQK